MINVKELRIGNFILDDEGLLAKVVGFSPFEHSVRCDEEEGCQIKIDFWTPKGELKKGWVVDSPECEPVPLSFEWLEGCGFQKDRGGWNLPSTQFSLTDNLFPCWLDRMLWPGGLPDFHHVQLQYVHELQNLYFALTGNELAITPPQP